MSMITGGDEGTILGMVIWLTSDYHLFIIIIIIIIDIISKLHL